MTGGPRIGHSMGLQVPDGGEGGQARADSGFAEPKRLKITEPNRNLNRTTTISVLSTNYALAVESTARKILRIH